MLRVSTENCPFRRIESSGKQYSVPEQIELIPVLKRRLEEEQERPTKRTAQQQKSWTTRERLYQRWRSSVVDYWRTTDPQRFQIHRFIIESDELEARLEDLRSHIREYRLREGQMVIFTSKRQYQVYRRYYYIRSPTGTLALVAWKQNGSNSLIYDYFLNLGLTMGDLEQLQRH